MQRVKKCEVTAEEEQHGFNNSDAVVWSKDGQRDQQNKTQPRNRTIHTRKLHQGEMQNYKSA